MENVLASHLHLELDNVIKLAKKADKSFYGKNKKPKEIDQDDFKEETPIDLRMKIKNRPRLTVHDKLEITHKVLIDF